MLKALFLILLSSCFFIKSANANLVIHINQGVEKPFPIALIPFSTQSIKSKVLPQGFMAVIQSDLNQTGQFSFVKPSLISSKPILINQFPFKQWAKKQIPTDYVLIGSLKNVAQNDHYNASFQLINAYTRHPMLARKYRNVSAKSLRQLAHEMANRIYHAITGVKGNFGSKIAYVLVQNPQSRRAKYRLVISDSDGFNPQTLLYQVGQPIASPKFSSDGKEIAYVSYHKNRMTIFVITLATGKRRIIANYPGINSAPAFSPDNEKMAMALSMGRGSNTDIYVYDFGSKHLKRMTRLGTNTSPSFTPDGKSIVFTSNRGGRPQIYQINLANRSVSRLSFDGAQNFSPEVAPDGRHIIMMHQGISGGPIRIASLNPDSGAVRVITKGMLDKSPSISPNGKMVIYANYDKPRGILAETSINGRVQLILPSNKGSVQSPAWA